MPRIKMSRAKCIALAGVFTLLAVAGIVTTAIVANGSRTLSISEAQRCDSANIPDGLKAQQQFFFEDMKVVSSIKVVTTSSSVRYEFPEVLDDSPLGPIPYMTDGLVIEYFPSSADFQPSDCIFVVTRNGSQVSPQIVYGDGSDPFEAGISCVSSELPRFVGIDDTRELILLITCATPV